ncbi:cysteine/serine-rich nuclear protein 2 [Ornithorhynchus anatinus]|uniref:cysteine/serine-rich nuclear protein 2 n=1 Tax=Ornithorhynchus anatinus TaxID=9258 RepID=UPI0010A7BDA6|nr:cysteine/serine-rich nuclear protein 2 [Ornithorhynchus anatinus]
MDAFAGSGLKRKFEEVDAGSSLSNSDDEISSSDSADSCDSLNPPSTTGFTPTSILKRKQQQLRRKSVRFDQVTVYYFARRQGFTSVPSQGGSSLGMAQRHNSVRSYTLGEFAQEQEVNHRQVLRDHLKEEKLHAKKMKLTKNGTVESVEAEGLTLDDVSDEDLDVESVEVDDYFFLQPLPTKRRRALLRAAGVHRIDADEKRELRAIRLSREECGCDCRLYCDPEACACSQAGIKCQVDRMSFPCGCSRDGCGNAAGRIEFNPLRVRTHYLHTIMKLELESKRQVGRPPAPDEDPAPAAAPAAPASPAGPPGAETQDFQEFIAENETAVLHLQSAEERERLQAGEPGDPGDPAPAGLASVCLLEDPPGGPGGPCPGPAAPLLIQARLPSGPPVLCFAEDGAPAGPVDPASVSGGGSVLYYQLEPRAAGDGAGDPQPAPAFPGEKDLGVFALPATAAAGAPGPEGAAGPGTPPPEARGPGEPDLYLFPYLMEGPARGGRGGGPGPPGRTF